MPKKTAILIIGSEILDGRICDTNSNLLARLLEQNGLAVETVITCPDRLPRIREALQFLTKDHHAVIISGGLGPTSDDLTREAVADFLHKELITDSTLLAEMEARCLTRGRPFLDCNKKQAAFPAGSAIVPNPWGTAPGFMIEGIGRNGKYILAALPGVPKELEPMFGEMVLPALLARLNINLKIHKKVLRIFGKTESAVQTAVTSCDLPESLDVSYRASLPVIELILKSEADPAALEPAYEKVLQAVGANFVFASEQNVSLAEVIHRRLSEAGLTLATAESCTGGLAGKLLTDLPGSSKYYLGGVVSYANEAKIKLASVNPATIETQGAVSADTAKQLAENIKEKLGSDFAVSITGIAGPDGGSPEKPVGTFFVGLAAKDFAGSIKFFFPSERYKVRIFAAHAALDVLRRYLDGLPIAENGS